MYVRHDVYQGATDGEHCLVCGREVPSEGHQAHGIIDLTYPDTGKAVVSCNDHQDALEWLRNKCRFFGSK